MSPLHLIWIVPLCLSAGFSIGLFAFALCAIGERCDERKKNTKPREKSRGFLRFVDCFENRATYIWIRK